MKKTIEVVYGNSLKINRGNYEQESPLFSIKTVVKSENGEFNEGEEYLRLKNIVDSRLKEHWDTSRLDLSKVRVRIKEGVKYPSVTSILNPDPLPIDQEYKIRGIEIHRLVKNYIETGNWKEPEALLFKLKYSDIPYQRFFEENALQLNFSNAHLNKEIFHEEYRYSGEFDLICHIGKQKALVDIKTGNWDWAQLMAYYKCGIQADLIGIFDLKKCELQTIEPTSKKAIDAWEKFLIKRGEFRARFGI